MFPVQTGIHQWLSQSALVSNLLAMMFVIALSFLVLRLNTAYAFIRIRTFLPSNIFVLIVSGLLSLHALHPVYFALLFLLLCVDRIFQSYELEQFHASAFEAGFFIGLGSLFYLNLIFFFPVIWIGFLLIKKQYQWRNFILPLMGVGVPWLFTWSYYFLTDQCAVFTESITVNLYSDNHFLRDNLPLQIYLGFLTVLTLLSSIFSAHINTTKRKSVPVKTFRFFFLIFSIAFVLLIAVPAVSQEILIIMSLPLTFLISNYLIFMKRKFWSNLFMYLFIALIIYMQFV